MSLSLNQNSKSRKIAGFGWLRKFPVCTAYAICDLRQRSRICAVHRSAQAAPAITPLTSCPTVIRITPIYCGIRITSLSAYLASWMHRLPICCVVERERCRRNLPSMGEGSLRQSHISPLTGGTGGSRFINPPPRRRGARHPAHTALLDCVLCPENSGTARGTALLWRSRRPGRG